MARYQTNLSHSHIYCQTYQPRQPQLPEQRQYWKLSLSEHAVNSAHYNTIIIDLLSQPLDHYYTPPHHQPPLPHFICFIDLQIFCNIHVITY